MTTKTSQKTEDMLDQTFANFDSEVTGAQTQETQSAPTAPKKPSNNNNILFIGAGVAAVGVVGYMIVKPMLQPQQQDQNPVQAQAPATQLVGQTPVAPITPVQVEQAPVTQLVGQTPVAPVTPVQVEQAPVTQLVGQTPIAPVTPVQAQAQVTQLVGQTPVAPITPVQAQAQVTQLVGQTPIAPVTPVQAQAPVTQLVGQTPIAPVTVGNAQSTAIVEELKSMFEQQNNEFKGILTGIDSRMESIESTLVEQRTFNEKVGERLDILESGKKPKTVIKNTGENEKQTKPVKKVHHVASHIKKVVSKIDSDSVVLVDKSTEAEKTKAEKSNLPKIEFHSVYGGRVWLKNADGSLSTYSNGDRLPTGEIIKNVNDENLEVVTDKRTIKN